MRICFGISTYSSLLEPRMGSERAVMGAAKALAKRGHKVDIVPLLHDAPKEGYDVYHWWNAGGPKGPLLAFARFAHELGKPCVCTPIYWPPTPGFYRLLVEWNGEEKALEFLRTVSAWNSSLAKAVAETDFMCPNSEREGDLVRALVRSAGREPPPGEWVPNAVDLDEIESVEPVPWEERDLIACVARLEPAKGQHRLASAFGEFREKHPEAGLVLAGEMQDGYLCRYRKAFYREGINLPGLLKPPKVMALLAESRVHVMLSMHDTPGLSHLEAAALGCGLVVSLPDYGTFREYWPREWLVEVDPLDEGSVYEGLERAWRKPPPEEMATFTRERYNYGVVAEKLEKIYDRLLGGG